MNNKRNILKNHHIETNLFTRRIIVSVVLIVLLLATLIGRLFYLQVANFKLYATLSEQNQLTLIPIDPARGRIYDRNGVILADNYPAYSLDVIPNIVPDFDTTLEQLKKIINITPEDLEQYKKALKQHHQFDRIPLKLKLTDEEVARFYLNQYRFPGVVITARMMRYYPYAGSMVSAIGYVGRINEQEAKTLDQANYSASNYIGKMGVEKYYETQLHGTVGYQQVETDASGRVVRVLKRIPPIPGDNLYLSIDSKLQMVAEQALGDDAGAVVAIDPQTGEVLALASKPNYDPNLFVRGIPAKEYKALQDAPDRPLYNRAIRGLYATGSTIKPYYALQGLDTNTITTEFKIHDPGWFALAGSSHLFRDWVKTGHGIVDVHKAIVQSCDVFFYTLASKMGITKMDDILSRFGFGQKTGLDVDEEVPGILPSPKWKRAALGQPWFTGDTINIGIGQGYMLTTPLHMAHAASIIANRGISVVPHLLKSAQQPDGTITPLQPVKQTTVILNNPENWNVVINAMEGVITEPHGTASRFGRTPPYTVAGKTGTAQVPRPLKYNEMDDVDIPKPYKSNSLFIAFAPVDNPKIVVAVLVEHHHGQAVVVAKQVIDYYLINVLHIAKAPSEIKGATVPTATPAQELPAPTQTGTTPELPQPTTTQGNDE